MNSLTSWDRNRVHPFDSCVLDAELVKIFGELFARPIEHLYVWFEESQIPDEISNYRTHSACNMALALTKL